MVVSSPFGEWLRLQRQSAGLSQRELAEKAGISRRAISDIERGAHLAPYHHTVQAIYRAMPPLQNERIEESLVAARRRAPRQAVAKLQLAPLPDRLSGFVGRERELLLLTRALREGGARFVTITGPAGVGKSRLALELITRLTRTGDFEAALVETGELTHPSQVIPAISRALGIQPVEGASLVDLIGPGFEGRSLILLLDDFERVLEGGADVVRLVERWPQLRVVVTSTGPVLVGGERQFPLQPLALSPNYDASDLAGISRSPAVQLFVMRAVEQSPDFRLTRANAATVGEIVARLDGLPLAIELAARRVPSLSPEELLAKLDNRLELLTTEDRDLPRRHRTLRRAIAWGYESLSPEAARLFRLIAVCRSGADLDLAARFAGSPDQSHSITLDLLQAIVRQGLMVVRRDPRGRTRYQMLETVREFALEELDAREGREHSMEALAEALQELAEDAAPHLWGLGRDEWCDRLAMERENIRAVLAWSCVARPQAAVSLLLTLHDWFFSESPAWVESYAYEVVQAGRNQKARWLGQALLNVSRIEWLLSRTGRSLDLLREGIPMLRGESPPGALAEALKRFAEITRRKSTAEALEAVNESIQLYRAAGDRLGELRALTALAQCRIAQGLIDDALPMLLENAAAQLELGDVLGACLSGGQAAWRMILGGEFEKARETSEGILSKLPVLQSVRGMPVLHLVRGQALLHAGAVQEGARELSTVIHMSLTTGARLSLPSAVQGAAWLALRANNAGKAARLLGIAEHWEQAMDIEVSIEPRLLMQTRTGIIQELDPDSFEMFRFEGFQTPLEAGTREALELTRAFSQRRVTFGGREAQVLFSRGVRGLRFNPLDVPDDDDNIITKRAPAKGAAELLPPI